MKVSLPWTCCLLLLAAACSQTPVATTPEPSAPEASAPIAEAPAAAPATTPPAQARNEPMLCHDPRPRVCTMIYDPVCATRDTGVRCITTPCPSSELKTMSSGCSACSDAKVLSYVKGECPAH